MMDLSWNFLHKSHTTQKRFYRFSVRLEKIFFLFFLFSFFQVEFEQLPLLDQTHRQSLTPMIAPPRRSRLVIREYLKWIRRSPCRTNTTAHVY